MKMIVKVKKVVSVTHNVKRFVVERPEHYDFEPGQATHVSLNKPGWEEEDRAFTFTSLPDAKDLEFTIKIYPKHNGLTEQLDTVKAGDELILREVNGAIHYKGPGYFIAGGAGITPFIAIFRALAAKDQLEGNTLIFSNKTDKDIILKEELDEKLGHHVTYVITDQEDTDYVNGYIDETFLRESITDLTKHFYVCGPKEMTQEVNAILKNIGAETNELVFEQ